MASSSFVRVWDPFVRVSHWLVAVAFAVSYLTEGEPLVLHVWSGYLIGSLVVLRVLWGVVGPRHARFADFVYRPGTVLAYLRDIVLLRAPRHLGHSPAGGAMVILLLLSLAATVGTGLVFLAEDRGEGPLAGIVARQGAGPAEDLVPSESDGDGEDEREERGGRGESDFEELHELFANLTLILVIAHIAGVALASFAHRENLPKAMVTGRKRA